MKATSICHSSLLALSLTAALAPSGCGSADDLPPTEDVGHAASALSTGFVATLGAVDVNGRAYTFMQGGDGNLWSDWWNGSAWVWNNQGGPSSTVSIAGPVGVTTDTYGDPYAFVQGSDGHLWSNWWNGSAWIWSDQGTPGSVSPGVSVAGPVGAISAGYDMFAFVRGSDNKVYVNWWNASTSKWSWANQGAPSSSVSVAGPVGLTIDGSGDIYVFVQGSDHHLWTNWLNASTSSWSWGDQGVPSTSPSVTVAGPVGVTAPAGNPYIFVQGSDDKLYLNWWDPTTSSWRWSNQGAPSGSVTVAGPVGVTMVSNNAYSFVRGSDGHLWSNWWDTTTSSWVWGDQGVPRSPEGTSPGVTVLGPVGVTAPGGDPYIFVQGSDHAIYLNSWSGSKWAWIYQDEPDAYLINYGGTVMTTAVTENIFWGPSWQNSTFCGDKITGLDTLYDGFSGSNYAKLADEYSGNNGQVSATTTHLGHVVDYSTASSGHGALVAEICKMIPNPDPNGYYAVYTDLQRPSTVHDCAWHDYDTCPSGASIKFAFFYDLDTDDGCNPNDTETGHSRGLAALANVSGHELSEARTDPVLNTWKDSLGKEVADKCSWTFNVPYVTFSNGSIWKIQGEWSNNAYAASTGYPNNQGERGCLDGH